MDLTDPLVQAVVALALGPLAFVGVEVVKLVPVSWPIIGPLVKKKKGRQAAAIAVSVIAAVLLSVATGTLDVAHAPQVALVAVVAALVSWLTHKLRNANEAADARP